MINLNAGSLPVTVSYLIVSGAHFGVGYSALGRDGPYSWTVSFEPRIRIEPGLHAAQPPPIYIMRASEEASFAKAFRRSPRVISTGQLR